LYTVYNINLLKGDAENSKSVEKMVNVAFRGSEARRACLRE
jgi:hypothetical protein